MGVRPAMTMPVRYAVLFKAFFLDDFVRRRLAHVVAAAPGGDVHLLLDETAAAAGPSDFPRIIRYRDADIAALGFLPCGQGSLAWYNADYPLYLFRHLHPQYDDIVVVEYDAVPGIGLDRLVAECRAERVDFVGQPIAKTVDAYWWTSTMLQFYRRAEIRPTLICAAYFSAAAVRHLAACRLRQGAGHDPRAAQSWPIGETFVGTEIGVAGLRQRDLASFGPLRRYDWWPPVHEAELAQCAGEVFVHPVLHGRRYLRSLFKNGALPGLVALARALRATSFPARRTAGGTTKTA